MKLTVLGRYGPYAGPGGACTGYLVRAGDTRVLLDCGNGVLSRLQEHCRLDQLDAVVLSHLHADHCSDLFILRYALQVERQRGRLARPLLIHTLAEPEEEFRRLPYQGVYDVRTYTPEDTLRLGDLTLSFAPTRHWFPACAIRVEGGGRTLVFSADTGPSPAVVAHARGADLFLCEANLWREASEGHLNGFQAGEMARQAGVSRLVLTHLFPGVDPEAQRREAEAGFGGPVEVAREGATYDV